MRLIRSAAVAGLAALAGCQYAGPIDNPVGQSLTWFSYVGGEDIRNACGPDASDRFRFVYNGIYDKQVRSYDVRMLPDGRSAQISAFVRGEADLTRAFKVTEIGSLLSGKRARATMPIQGVSALRSALRTDGFRDFRPVGLQLPSNEFYWTAVACLNGRFHTNAWIYPTERFDNLKFPAVLHDFDRAGEPFYGARPVAQRDEDPRLDTDYEHNIRPFVLQLGPDGFVGTDAPF